MPRRPRLDLPGVPQHVIQRGVDRQAVFFCDEDRLVYLDWLGAYAAKRGITLHAYCLMTNHVHLLLSAPSSGAVGGLMQDVGRRYVQYVNRSYQRSGGLWQGRYKASHVQADAYVLACMRYIELNPVRASMVKGPGKYRWSSYRANALGAEKRGAEDLVVSPHADYAALGGSAEERQRAYRDLFKSAVDEPAWDLIRTATQQGAVVGDARFAAEIETRLGLAVQPRPRGRPPKQADEERTTTTP